MSISTFGPWEPRFCIEGGYRQRGEESITAGLVIKGQAIRKSSHEHPVEFEHKVMHIGHARYTFTACLNYLKHQLSYHLA